jgi:hypothetical protein
LWPLDLDLKVQRKGEGDLTVGLGFRSSAARLRAVVEVWRCCSGFQTTERPLRGSEQRGKLGSVVVVEIRFQEPKRDAAGGCMAAVSFGFKGACSIWSEIEQTKYIRRSACLKEDVWE